MQLSSTTLIVKRASLAVQFVGAGAATLSLLAFAFAYTDHEEWIRPAVFGPLIGEIAVAHGLLLTSPQHHDLYVTAVGTQTVDGIVYLERALGPAATVHVAVSYASVVPGIALLVRAALSSRNVFRSQSIAVIAGVTFPLLVNVVWFVGEGPQGKFDLTVVGFGLAIVETIANAHDWRVTVDESETGGARLDVWLDGDDEGDADATVPDDDAWN